MKVFRVDGEIYRGSMPDNWQKLRSLGIRKVICLQSGFRDYIVDGELYTLDKEAAAYGINVVHFPLSDFIPPSKKKLLEIVRYIEGCEHDREAIYVHCMKGKDRTGLVIAAYRILCEGWDVERAINEAIEYGFNTKWYWWWLKSFRKTIAKIKADQAIVRELTGV